MKHKTCFILGSGQSLLKLNDQELDHVNNSEFVLAFNKYIIFSDLVGIRPTHYLLGDVGYKADLMLIETALKCRKSFKDITFILSRYYEIGSELYCTRKRQLKKKSRYGYNVGLAFWWHNRADEKAIKYMAKNAVYIDRYDWLKGGAWAHSLNEKIYHYRSSLSGAINLANIIHPTYEIKLLGVDLDDKDYFFQKEIESNPEKWGAFLKLGLPDSEQHETIVNRNGTEGIQEVFPYMMQQVEATGGKLFCANPESYLVKNNLVPYSKICN